MSSWQEHIQKVKKEPGNGDLSFKDLLSKASLTWNKGKNNVPNKKTKKKNRPVKTQKIKRKHKHNHSLKKHKKHKRQTLKAKTGKKSRGGAGIFNQITSAVTGVFKAPNETQASIELRKELLDELRNDNCNKVMQIKEAITFANENSKLYNTLVNIMKLQEHKTLLDNIGIISTKSKFELNKLLDKLKVLKPTKTINNEGKCENGNFANENEKNKLIAFLENNKELIENEDENEGKETQSEENNEEKETQSEENEEESSEVNVTEPEEKTEENSEAKVTESKENSEENITQEDENVDEPLETQNSEENSIDNSDQILDQISQESKDTTNDTV